MNWHKISIHTSVDNEEVFTEFLTEISNGISVDYSMDIMKSGVEDFDNKFRLNPDDYPDSDIRLTVYYDESVSVDEKISQIESFVRETTNLSDKENFGNIRRMDQRAVFKKLIDYIKNNNINYLFIYI